jgi:hypothetical protein
MVIYYYSRKLWAKLGSMSDDSSGARESFSPESAAEALAQARVAAQQAGLGPSHEAMQEARAFDGPEHNWSSNTEGLTGAAAELAQAREASQARPAPPPLSDIFSGQPGGTMSWTLPGDPRDPKSALSPRQAAEAKFAGQAPLEAERDVYERAFAEQGLDWSDVLDGKVRIDPAAPEAPAQPQTSPELEQARQQAAEAQAEAQRQQQIAEAERQARQAFDQMNDQVRHQRYLIAGAAQELAAAFPEIRTQQDLQNAWVRGGVAAQRAAEYTRIANALNDKVLAAEALEARAQDVGRQANKAEAKRQDDLFISKHPEFDDPKQGPALQKQALASLKSAGFQEDELTRAWQGEAPLHLRDHRVQHFIADHARLANRVAELEGYIESARSGGKSAVTSRLPPPMMRPGVSDPGRSAYNDIRNAQARIARATTTRDGVQGGVDLLRAMRAGGRV